MKFNCSDATVVAHGEDAALVLTLLESPMVGTSKFGRVIIVSGSGAASVKRKTREKLATMVDVLTSSPTCKALATVYRGKDDPASTEPTEEDLHFISVAFALDPRSKQLTRIAK